MAWTSMHIATGMACGGALFGIGCAVFRSRRALRWLPLAMSAAGIWAIVPDLPRIWREDFPSLPLSSILGAKGLEEWLHSIGNLFFFHRSLDAQPKEFALHGVLLMLLFYNLGIVLLMLLPRAPRRNERTRSADVAAETERR
jgi:hypothetical protein